MNVYIMVEENNYEKFKNIGIDVDFIQTNADEQNNKIQQFYTGGNPEQTIQAEPVQQTAQKPVREQPEQSVVKEEGNEQKMDSQIDMSAIQALVDEKVHELALKMQQYADETDKKIAALESEFAQFKLNAPKSEAKQQTISQTTNSDEKPDTNEGGFNRSDVSIDKMFNFSGNASGNIKR